MERRLSAPRRVGTADSVRQLRPPHLALTHESGRCVPIYSPARRPGLAQAAGTRRSPSAAGASPGAEPAGFCRDPPLCAAGSLTRTHRWPGGSPRTCQGRAAGLLVPAQEDVNCQCPSFGPQRKTRALRGEEELLLGSPRIHPSEAPPPTGPEMLADDMER